ncbi:TM2 domain-containing protein [Paucibacter sp. R3-3]|uniref:TM2 domain-containing protein n=1 Tax=Roseateles agri TaxID=3098619 RepID=A0ABU5DLG1_9BURK|nr:TM2 domain-containing protein [Paucibacter sp. R3-3]MDY0746553.1 TM2 domain-containing protein [Paucibacter sp. R3-3]
MALMDCPECATRVSDKATSCPSCGYPIAKPATVAPTRPIFYSDAAPLAPSPTTVTVSKSRGVYIILGLLFGGWGFHNFYAGYNVAGAIKLVIFGIAFVLDASTRFYSGFSVVALVIFAVWALIEVISVKADAGGNAMT